jgi:hypothetical protein
MLRCPWISTSPLNSVIWKQVGAPPHYYKDAMPEPNIPGKMDRSWRYIPWPPTSPDLTPMAF